MIEPEPSLQAEPTGDPRGWVATVRRRARQAWPDLLAATLSADPTGEPIRVQRVRKFLKVHLILCLLGLANAGVETALGLQPDMRRQVATWLASGLPTLWTLAGFALFRRNLAIGYLIPIILSLDSVLMLLQIFQEASVESAWVATPVLLIVMMPLFSDRQRFVWVLAALQVGLLLLLLYLRHQGVLPYHVRTDDLLGDWNQQIFSWLGFVIIVAGMAVLSGTASVDVLNSQRQLQEVLRRQERQLQLAQARIIQQEKLVTVGQLTAGIAHEINNPLTFVQTNLTSVERDLNDLFDVLDAYRKLEVRLSQADPAAVAEIARLRDRLCLDEEAREVLGELLGDAREGLGRVQEIIRDLRVFSRLDEAESKVVDLREGIESTLKILRHRFEERRVRLQVDLEDLPQIEVFAAMFNQVVMNLLQNACDAAPEGDGLVRIATRLDRAAGRIVLEVADNGPGVPAELRDRIFDPFFTTKEVGAGTGLGLALSLEIVEKHDGRLTVGDAPEGGALFTVALPLQRRAT